MNRTVRYAWLARTLFDTIDQVQRKPPHWVDTQEVELSGMFRSPEVHEEVPIHRDPDRLDPQASRCRVP